MLKNKIAHARRCREVQTHYAILRGPIRTHPHEQFEDTGQSNDLNGDLKNIPMEPKPLSSKDIMKNYNRAIINFALSRLAEPYVSLSIQEHNISKVFLTNLSSNINTR